MKVDFHFHLEEGPYSLDWIKRTARALEYVHQGVLPVERNSIEYITELTNLLQQRVRQGSFSKDWLASYIKIGQARGIQKFGIVDHLYRFKEFRSYYEKHMILDDTPLGKKQKYWLDRVCMSSFEEYIHIVNQFRNEGYPISLGIETDYFIGGEEELSTLLEPFDFDYIIGSVHFIDGWGFDNPETQDLFEQVDLMKLYTRFFETVESAISSGIFDMVAHLDNLKVFNYRPDEAKLVPLYEKVAAALQKANIATEINTGLAYRYPIKEMCPSPAFLKILQQHDVPITLSSDSHFPDDIGTLLDDAKQLALDTGYESIVYFKNRERLMTNIKD